MSETKERYTFKPKAPAIISMTEADRDKLVAEARRKELETCIETIRSLPVEHALDRIYRDNCVKALEARKYLPGW